MPTTRPRHTITETDSVAEALAIARDRWPEESDSQLLRRLALMAAAGLRESDEAELARRRGAVKRYAGSLTGVYDDDYLESLRGEWPD